MDRGWPFRVPAVSFVPHPLNTDRPSDRFGEHRGIDCRIAGIASAVGAGPWNPDATDLFARQAQHLGNTIAGKMRFLRPGPKRCSVPLDLDDRSMPVPCRLRLERPFVFGFDHPPGAREDRFHIADIDLDLTFEAGACLM